MFVGRAVSVSEIPGASHYPGMSLRYRFEVIEAFYGVEGPYTVHAALPKDLPPAEPQQVEVPAGRCAGIELVLQPEEGAPPPQ